MERCALRVDVASRYPLLELELRTQAFDPVFGEDAQAMIDRLYATPPEAMARIQSIVRISK